MGESLKQMFDLVIWAIVGVIAVAGFLWGAWSLWESYNADQPEAKKRGIIILISTVVVVAFLLAAKAIIWGMISDKITTTTASILLNQLWR